MKTPMTVRTMDDQWKRNTKNGRADRKRSYSDGKWLEGFIADLLGERVSESQCGNKGRDWYTGNTWQTEGADSKKTTGWGRTSVSGRQPHAEAVQTVRKGWFEL